VNKSKNQVKVTSKLNAASTDLVDFLW